MPWQEQSTMSLRHEFVLQASQPDANIRALCRQYRISPTTGYTLLARFRAEGTAGLTDRSRRPHTTPRLTPPAIEAAVIALRQEHPAWGGRKLAARLIALGHVTVPHPNTITAILRRHGLLSDHAQTRHQAWQRWERDTPNALWQMDFKGHFPTVTARCHPLTLLDDHSRFALCLAACPDEQTATVQTRLTTLFSQYGLPAALLCDNGAPWGSTGSHGHTALTVWLLRLGIVVLHGRPRHPQTQGKEERFHRTLTDELLTHRVFVDLPDSQRAFDRWRDVYNCERPHEALDLAVPASRYRSSHVALPDPLPPVEYAAGTMVRQVRDGGRVLLHGHHYRIGQAFDGYPVALSATDHDGVWQVCFAQHRIATLDETTKTAKIV